MTRCRRVGNKITLTKFPVILVKEVHDPIMYRTYDDKLRLYVRNSGTTKCTMGKSSQQDSTDQNTSHHARQSPQIKYRFYDDKLMLNLAHKYGTRKQKNSGCSFVNNQIK